MWPLGMSPFDYMVRHHNFLLFFGMYPDGFRQMAAILPEEYNANQILISRYKSKDHIEKVYTPFLLKLRELGALTIGESMVGCFNELEISLRAQGLDGELCRDGYWFPRLIQEIERYINSY